MAAFVLLLAAGAAVGIAQIRASASFAWLSVGLSAATVVLTVVAVVLDTTRA